MVLIFSTSLISRNKCGDAGAPPETAISSFMFSLRFFWQFIRSTNIVGVPNMQVHLKHTDD